MMSAGGIFYQTPEACSTALSAGTEASTHPSILSHTVEVREVSLLKAPPKARVCTRLSGATIGGAQRPLSLHNPLRGVS